MKFVCIGHVDTGKSTFCGHLLYKTGYISSHELKKIQESAEKDKMSRWSWARILDIYESERAKGKTHEASLIDFTYGDNVYQLVDTPGHLSFIREMIKGIDDVNTAVLLVSALPNEFKASFHGGMLKEHLLLARCRNLTNLVVLINKMDTINWSETGYLEVKQQVTKYLREINWKKDMIHYLAISAWEGTGLLDSAGRPEWCYNQPSFLELMDTLSETRDTPTQPKTSIASKLLVKAKFFTNHIITAGTELITHYDNHEAETTILAIKGKTLIKKGESGELVIKLKAPIKCYNKQRLIFRVNQSTLGFGVVTGYK